MFSLLAWRCRHHRHPFARPLDDSTSLDALLFEIRAATWKLDTLIVYRNNNVDNYDKEYLLSRLIFFVASGCCHGVGSSFNRIRQRLLLLTTKKAE